jgi:hypothetical protein
MLIKKEKRIRKQRRKRERNKWHKDWKGEVKLY